MTLKGLVTEADMDWICYKLGHLYAARDKLSEAERMYRQALADRGQALGAEHTSTLHTVNNIGALCSDQGKLDEAERMYQRALEGYEKALDTENVTIYIPALNTLSNLGSHFECQADLAHAKILYSKALVGYEKVVGPNHPRSRILQDILRTIDAAMENEPIQQKPKSISVGITR